MTEEQKPTDETLVTVTRSGQNISVRINPNAQFNLMQAHFLRGELHDLGNSLVHSIKVQQAQKNPGIIKANGSMLNNLRKHLRK